MKLRPDLPTIEMADVAMPFGSAYTVYNPGINLEQCRFSIWSLG
jgi:hypothetical protein